MIFKDKTILITGGTGSFGTRFIEHLLRDHDPNAVRIFSRDELKQWDLQRRFGDDERLRYLIGDVRDGDRLVRATRGVDMIVHAAALKHVPVCEYNPFEAVKTNIHGAENIVSAAIENDVPLTVNLSTDKAVNPVNLYGATKLAAEKIINQGNAYAGDSQAHFASVRYGNVVGSRGSVVPLFKRQAESGKITITDDRMTRFWITLDQAVQFVVDSAGRMGGRRDLHPAHPLDAGDRHGAGARARGRGRDHRHPAGREAARAAGDRRRVAPRLQGGQRLRDHARVPLLEAQDARERHRAPRRLHLLVGRQRLVARRGRAAGDDGRREGGGLTATFLPYGRQEITEADVRAVTSALREPLITQGPLVEEFEQAMAGHVGARHAVAFSSGTAALHGAAHAVGIGPGDEAIVPPITFAASANCVLYQGGDVRFGDIARDTWNLDTAAAAAAVGERTKAVVAVSYTGLPVDLEPLAGVRDRVAVIEDGCHALGGHRGGRPVGGPGGADITCFSLHPVKSMTTGEGGLATTEDDELAARMRRFRTHGMEREHFLAATATDGPWYMEQQDLGFNYRITDFQCALGISQLERLDGWVRRRNEIAARYRELLQGQDVVEAPPAAPEGSLHGHHLFVIRVVAGAEARLRVFEGLRAAGIGVQVHYIPIYRFPYYRDVVGAPQDACPNAEELYAGAISLPMFPAMEDADVDRVVTELLNLAS